MHFPTRIIQGQVNNNSQYSCKCYASTDRWRDMNDGAAKADDGCLTDTGCRCRPAALLLFSMITNPQGHRLYTWGLFILSHRRSDCNQFWHKIEHRQSDKSSLRFTKAKGADLGVILGRRYLEQTRYTQIYSVHTDSVYTDSEYTDSVYTTTLCVHKLGSYSVYTDWLVVHFRFRCTQTDSVYTHLDQTPCTQTWIRLCVHKLGSD